MSASEEGENHWPGYVDALTTMTMMLIFVMMILSIALFSLSENVSRTLVEKIATSAGLTIASDGISIDDYAEKLIEQLEKRGAQGKQDGALPQPGMQGGVTQSPGSQGASVVTVQAPRQPGSQAQGGGAALNDGNAAVPTKTPGQADVPGPDKQIESAAVARGYMAESAVGVTRAQALMTLAFKPRATALDEPSQAEIKAFIDAEGFAAGETMFDLIAYASTDFGGLSDARRVAYYRAMAVRARLISLGVAPTRLKVQVLDKNGVEQADRVQVVVRSPAATAPPSPANGARG